MAIAFSDPLLIANFDGFPVCNFNSRVIGLNRRGRGAGPPKGDVFIADAGYGKVFEYAHGRTKRIATISAAGPDPSGCAFDPTTGDLAVVNLGFSNYGTNAYVAIYKNHLKSKPVLYQSTSFYQYWFCGYDAKGNLYVDGLSKAGTGNFIFAELVKGSSHLKVVSLNQYIGWPGGVQWDGEHVAVGDDVNADVYEFAVNGSHGEKVGSTPLGSGAKYVAQYFIDNKALIAPNQIAGSDSDVLFYKYPTGGRAVRILKKGVRAAHGVAVSPASGY
jgi:hypothetical protein